MSAKIFNWLGLIVIAGIIAVLARNPQIVQTFFSGFNSVLGTALAGGEPAIINARNQGNR